VRSSTASHASRGLIIFSKPLGSAIHESTFKKAAAARRNPIRFTKLFKLSRGVKAGLGNKLIPA
jgi:hypothetical protein